MVCGMLFVHGLGYMQKYVLELRCGILVARSSAVGEQRGHLTELMKGTFCQGINRNSSILHSGKTHTTQAVTKLVYM